LNRSSPRSSSDSKHRKCKLPSGHSRRYL
jgi:hypothetical protein